MMLTTTSGTFPIPADVARLLPQVPPIPSVDAPDFKALSEAFNHWLDASPSHTIDFERLRRWHLVQEELAAKALASRFEFVVTSDGLD